jgi:hypothetical protein
VFSLERGTEDYRQLYAAILNQADGAQASSSSAGAANTR